MVFFSFRPYHSQTLAQLPASDSDRVQQQPGQRLRCQQHQRAPDEQHLQRLSAGPAHTAGHARGDARVGRRHPDDADEQQSLLTHFVHPVADWQHDHAE